QKLQGLYGNILSCYEAGPCGFGLYHQLTAMNIKCQVIAPSRIPNYLERQFAVTEPNQVWCGDVTYSVPGVQGGHGCLNEPRVC
ncbi:hypothetical protein ACQ2HC_26410, partial [Escherichia coli]